MNLLAIDPGSTVFGWSYFQQQQLTIYGEVDISKLHLEDRFPAIVRHLARVREKYPYDDVACEKIMPFKGRSIPALEMSYLIIRDWMKRQKLTFSSYTPGTWKAVIGDVHASKEMTETLIRKRYPLLPQGLGEHIIDSIGIGLYHCELNSPLSV
jgi:Holliday junction resolvasome RuvABC endonuclease subunit